MKEDRISLLCEKYVNSVFKRQDLDESLDCYIQKILISLFTIFYLLILENNGEGGSAVVFCSVTHGHKSYLKNV